MKSITSLCLTSLLIASANAATYNAQGKIINSKDAKNPGIVVYEKAKVINQNKKTNHNILAKTNSNDRVTKSYAIYNSDESIYYMDGYKKSFKAFFDTYVNPREEQDAPRNNYQPLNLSNNAARYRSNNGDECKVVAGTLPTNKHFYKQNDRQMLLDYVTGTSFGVSIYDNYDKTSFTCNSTGNHLHLSLCLGSLGSGINIYNVVGDKKIDITKQSCKNETQSNQYALRDYKLGIDHFFADKLVSAIAPYATRYTIDEGDARKQGKFAAHPQNPYTLDMHIGNTIATSSKNVVTYNEESAYLDDYIYNNRVIEFVPYTENGTKTGAGIAMNAISVGGIEQIYYENGTQKGLFVNKVNVPRLPYAAGYAKPEIYHLGNMYFKYDKQVIEYGPQNALAQHVRGYSDNWGASSLAAAMTAVLLSKQPFYKWHPEVVKALWLTAYSEELPNLYYNSNKVLVQGKHISTIQELMSKNVSRYWYGNNDDFFKNETETFVASVEPGKKYAAAIAWLVRGDYALNESEVSSNYTLTIKDSKTGKILNTPENSVATYRFAELIIPAGVTQLKFEIKRIKNTGDRIILGFNLHKVSSN